MSLRLKLLLGLVVSIVLVLLPFWLIAEKYITESLQADYQSRAAAALHIFQAIADGSNAADLRAVQEQADLLIKADPNFRQIQYYIKKNGRVVTAASTDPRTLGRPGDASDAEPFRTGKRRILSEHSGVLEIHEPVLVDGRVVAVVGAYFRSPFQIRLWRQMLFVLAGFLSVLVLAYLILDRSIIAPIRKLERAAASVARGAFTMPLETKRRDEFGSLAGRFNEMLAALQVQDRENRALQQKLKDSFDQAQLEANTDTLTQLFNRRYLEKQLKRAVTQTGLLGQQMACVFCDLDGFKDYNDINGHQKGDEALRTVGIIIKACLRESDVAARYGGEEFALVLPDTDLDGARAVADRIRRAVANFAGESQHGRPALTMSIGIAMLDSKEISASELIHQADIAMYRAKKNGKNCIVVNDEARLKHESRRS